MRELILVDGFNVLHAGVLRGRDRAGWWRAEAQAKLLSALAPLAGGPAELGVVFDARGEAGGGPPPIDAGEEGGTGACSAVACGIAVLRAPSADDRIVEEVRREAPRRPVTVVTSDRELVRRAREAGARTLGAGAFLASLKRGGPAG